MINSYSTTFGTPSSVKASSTIENKTNTTTNTNRPFDTKKPVTAPIPTKPIQNQPRKMENTNPMGFPDYSQMQNGYMPWPMFFYPPQGMNYDPNQMTQNPMYNPMYYMQQPGEMEEGNFMKGKKPNFPQQSQTPNLNVIFDS